MKNARPVRPRSRRFPGRQPAVLRALACSLLLSVQFACSDSTLPNQSAAAISNDASHAIQGVMIAPESKEPYGINTVLGRTTGATLANYARDANIGWVRLTFYWNDIQKTRGGVLSAPDMDLAVQNASSRGLKVLGTIHATPSWANRGRASNYAPCPEFYPDWDQFVQGLVNKYPYVTHWSIWNEPNAPAFFTGCGSDPWGEYIALVQRAAPIIRASGDKVVVAEFAYVRTPADTTVQHPQLRRLLNAVGGTTDVVAMHMYGDPPTIVNVMKALSGELNGVSGGWRWPLWLTEVGEDTSPNQTVQRTYLQTIYTGMRGASASSRWEKTFYFSQIHEHAFGGSCPGTDYPIRGILNGEWAAYLCSDMSRIQPRLAYDWYKNWAWNLGVSFSGPTYINTPGTYTWTASASGGSGAYTFRWESRSPSSSTWSQLGTGTTYTRSIQSGDGPFYLRVTATSGVTATSAGVSKTYSQYINACTSSSCPLRAPPTGTVP